MCLIFAFDVIIYFGSCKYIYIHRGAKQLSSEKPLLCSKGKKKRLDTMKNIPYEFSSEVK